MRDKEQFKADIIGKLVANKISKDEAVALMNDIYLNTWSKLQNFFIPQRSFLVRPE